MQRTVEMIPVSGLVLMTLAFPGRLWRVVSIFSAEKAKGRRLDAPESVARFDQVCRLHVCIHSKPDRIQSIGNHVSAATFAEPDGRQERSSTAAFIFVKFSESMRSKALIQSFTFAWVEGLLKKSVKTSEGPWTLITPSSPETSDSITS